MQRIDRIDRIGHPVHNEAGTEPMSGIDDRYSSSGGPRMPRDACHGFGHVAREILLGSIGITLIT